MPKRAFIVSDEELLLAHRKGDPNALSELSRRFFAMRFYCCQKAAPELLSQLDDWSLNEAFFRSFLNATSNYEFQRVKFVTFFTTVLKNELIRVVKLRSREMLYHAESIDVPHETEDGCYTLCDIVQSSDFMDDPAAFFSFSDSLRELGRLPKNISPRSVDAVSLLSQGYTIDEISKMLRVSVAVVRHELTRYRKWAVDVIAQAYGLDEKGRKEKEKAFNDLMNLGSEDLLDD